MAAELEHSLSQEMNIVAEQTKKAGSIFFYCSPRQMAEPKSEFGQMVRLDKEYIDSSKIESIRDLLIDVTGRIPEFEKNDPSRIKTVAIGTTIVCHDIVLRIIDVHIWRRGSIYVCLQISSMNSGNARIVLFATDTVHHSAQCFGTTPDVSESEKIVQEYYNNTQRVISDIVELKKINDDVKLSAEELFEKLHY